MNAENSCKQVRTFTGKIVGINSTLMKIQLDNGEDDYWIDLESDALECNKEELKVGTLVNVTIKESKISTNTPDWESYYEARGEKNPGVIRIWKTSVDIIRSVQGKLIETGRDEER